MEFIKKENEIFYENEKGERLAEVKFPAVDENTVDINRTFVDASLRGTGMAGKLMKEAALHIRAQGKKAVLTCSYAVQWFAHHEEFQDIVK